MGETGMDVMQKIIMVINDPINYEKINNGNEEEKIVAENIGKNTENMDRKQFHQDIIDIEML